jgi:hypothetical protein
MANTSAPVKANNTPKLFLRVKGSSTRKKWAIRTVMAGLTVISIAVTPLDWNWSEVTMAVIGIAVAKMPKIGP